MAPVEMYCLSGVGAHTIWRVPLRQMFAGSGSQMGRWQYQIDGLSDWIE